MAISPLTASIVVKVGQASEGARGEMNTSPRSKNPVTPPILYALGNGGLDMLHSMHLYG